VTSSSYTMTANISHWRVKFDIYHSHKHDNYAKFFLLHVVMDLNTPIFYSPNHGINSRISANIHLHCFRVLLARNICCHTGHSFRRYIYYSAMHIVFLDTKITRIRKCRCSKVHHYCNSRKRYGI